MIGTSTGTAYWNAKRVGKCMVRAFEVLKRQPGSGILPAGFKTFWPEINRLHEWEVWTLPQEPRRLIVPIKPEDVSLMDLALRWPMQYLDDQPKAADALNLWAASKAHSLHIGRILERRYMEAVGRMNMAGGSYPDDFSAVVISRTSLHRWRYVGATIIAERLEQLK